MLHTFVLFLLSTNLATAAPESVGDARARASPPDGAISGRLDTLPPPPKFFAKVSYVTSRAPGKDFRSFQQQNGDDAGNVNMNSTLPNLNYVSASAMVSPGERHHFMLGGTQSLDSSASRQIGGPGMPPMPLPGSIAAAMYSFDITRQISLQAGEVYVDAFGFTDPLFGSSYRAGNPEGLLSVSGIGFSAPLSPRSREDHLLSQLTLRTAIAQSLGLFTVSGHVTYARAIYKSGADVPEVMGPDGTLAKGSPSTAPGPNAPPAPPPGSPPPGAPGPARPATPGGSPPPLNVLQPDPNALEIADLVMRERIIDRTNVGAGISLRPKTWRFSSGAGATYVQTARQHAIWLTTARVLGISYGFGQAEAGIDAQIYSDIHRYDHPSLPKLWNVGMHLSYLFGPEPRLGI